MKLFSKVGTAAPHPRRDRALHILLSFIIPALVLILALIGLRCAPFGEKHSLAISDGKCYLNSQMFFRVCCGATKTGSFPSTTDLATTN